MKTDTTAPANGSAPGAPPLVEPATETSAEAVASETSPGSRSPVVRFARDFDYTWPSRAVTAYKADWQGRVKVEVATAAEAAGVLTSPLDETAVTK